MRSRIGLGTLLSVGMGVALLCAFTASAAGPPTVITLPQALEVALREAGPVRAASVALESARLNLTAAQKDAGPQIVLGSTSTPLVQIAHQDNSPLVDLSDLLGPILGDESAYGLADTQELSLGASVDYNLGSGGTLSLQYTGDRRHDRLVDDGRENDDRSDLATIRLRQPLFRDTRWQSPYYEVRVAARGVERAALGLRQARRDTYLQVTQAFCAVLQAQDEAGTAARYVTLLEENLARTEALAKVGNASALDVEAAQIELAKGQLASSRNAQSLSLAKRRLGNLLGFTPDESARAEDVPLTRLSYPLETVVAAEVAHNLDIATHELDVTEAEEAVSRAASAIGPRLDANAAYDSDATWVVGLVASISFSRDAAERDRTAKAQKELAEAKAAFKDAKSAADVEGAQDYYDLINAEKELDIAERNLDHARRKFEVAKRRAEIGTISEHDVLETLVDYNRAENDRNAARYKYLAAAAKVQAAMGNLDQQ